MTYICMIFRPGFYKNRNRRFVKKLAKLQCDFCGEIFERVCNVENAKKFKEHFCNKEHMDEAARKGNLLDIRKKATRKTHGICQSDIMTSFWNEMSEKERIDLQQHRENSMMKNFGVKNVWQLPEVIAKCNTEESIEKSRQTCQKNYGVDSPLQNEEIFNKVQRSRQKKTVLIHWKTNRELICTASYEIAFVNWANANQIDFDWQIPIKTDLLTPKGYKAIYHIDAFIKSGEFTGMWVEIKGFFPKNRRIKWEWFHSKHPNDSQLWNLQQLEELKILVKKKPNPEYERQI